MKWGLIAAAALRLQSRLSEPPVEPPESAAPAGLVRLVGLKHHPELNGAQVHVLRRRGDEAVVELESGEQHTVHWANVDASPQAFAQVAAKPLGDDDDAVLDHLQGHFQALMTDAPAEGARAVQEASRFAGGNIAAGILGGQGEAAEEPQAAPQQDVARVVGMTHETALNGQIVKVLGVDDKSGRIVVKLRDGSQREVKEDHLEAVDGAGPPQPAGAGAEEGAGPEGANQPEDVARLVGMKSDTSLNGQIVKVLGVDDKSGRIVVKLQSGAEKRVLQDHLEALPSQAPAAPAAKPAQDVATLVGMTHDASLNGVRVAVERVDKDSGRYVVRLSDGSERRVRGEHLEVAEDTPFAAEKVQSRARLVGFTSHKALNGQVVNVLGIDAKSGRYVVRLHDGSKEKVLPSNLGSLAVQPEPVAARHDNATVEVLGFDKDSAEYVLAGTNGTLGRAPLEELGGLSNTTARTLAAMAIAGEQLPPLPKLTVCNAYPSHRPMTVLVRHGQDKDLLLAAALQYPSCVDAEFPVQLGTLAFLLDADGKNTSLQVGEYPFLQRTVGEREVLVVHRSDVNSLQAAITKTVVPAELPEHEAGRVVAVNAFAGTLRPDVQLIGTLGGKEHSLGQDQLYSVQPGRYDFALQCDGGKMPAAALDIRPAQTFLVVLTGAGAGVEGEPTAPGLLLHGVEAFTTAQTAEFCADRTPVAAKVAMLQLSASFALVLLGFAL